MAERYPCLNDRLIKFIRRQHIYFVATAAREGRVNLSPKGGDTLRILAADSLVWLNLTGSGNESAGHLLDSNRMTLMFCSFEEQAMILRLYGSAEAVHEGDARWAGYEAMFGAPRTGTRQFFLMTIDLVQTSCGYNVPYFDYQGERPTLDQWAERKGREGIRAYWAEKNRLTLDGQETQIVEVSAEQN